MTRSTEEMPRLRNSDLLEEKSGKGNECMTVWIGQGEQGMSQTPVDKYGKEMNDE